MVCMCTGTEFMPETAAGVSLSAASPEAEDVCVSELKEDVHVCSRCL
jgi:hypothetical protein